MTTSGVANFDLDLNDIVEEAFERAGSELRTGYDLRTARRSLNLLFADWANRGVNMWTFEQNVITLAQGQPTYALPDDTVDLLDHVIRTNANVPNNQADLTITRISVSTYATIPNKLIQGRPIQVWVQKLTAQDSVLAGTLQATILSTTTQIPITSLVGVPNAGFIKIGTELIAYNEVQVASNGNPAYLLNCARGQDGTTAAGHSSGAAITLSQKQSITVWPTPNAGTTYQFVYWRMRRIQDATNSGVKTFDVPFRFLPCLVAGLSYYIALKIPDGIQRLEILKAQYDEAWQLAAGQDQEKAAVRFVPRQMYIGSGT
jgi:chorismate mutase